MTIQKSDFTPSEQALIQTWIDTEIPARVAAYQETVVTLTASLGTLNDIDGLFKKVYDSWTDLHRDFGFLAEIRASGNDTGNNWFDPPVLETELASTAYTPLGSRLFPAGWSSTDPFFAYDFRANSADFDLAEDPYTGTASSPTLTGYNEWKALDDEETEWGDLPNPPGTGSEDVVRANILAQEQCLLNQIAAIDYMLGNLSVGQGGYANLSGARSVAVSALGIVQGHISNFPTLPGKAGRLTEISTRKGEIEARVDQVISPGTDPDFVKNERWFWLRLRMNLSFGSISRVQGTQRSIDLLNARIADLQAELVKYTEMGF